MKTRLGVFLSLFFLIFNSYAAPKADLIAIGVGAHDVMRDEYRTAEFRLELKPHWEWATFRPLLGGMVTAKKTFYIYGGFWFDWVIKNRLQVSPSLCAGYFNNGDSKDMGYPLQFRSAIEIGWVLKNEMRLGVQFYHISNASLGHKNPGEESLMFSLSIPIKRYK